MERLGKYAADMKSDAPQIEMVDTRDTERFILNIYYAYICPFLVSAD